MEAPNRFIVDEQNLNEQENNPDILQQLYDPGRPVGPIELNLLERVENGLNVSEGDVDSEVANNYSLSNEDQKYEGPREVIFVTGWVNINSVYERYKWAFVFKIFLGILVLVSLFKNNQNFWPVAAGFCLINLVHVIKNAYFLYAYWNSNIKIKVIFIAELHISLGYFIYFFGFLLFFLRALQPKFLPLFVIPYFIVSTVLFFYNSDEHMYLSQKKFAIVEAVQLLLIALKLSQISNINWSYTLFFFMAGAIYLTVLGLFMVIILSCSLFGFLYRNLESWKVRSLIWMTWYYFCTGIVYVYFIKGAMQFYKEDDFMEPPIVDDYAVYKSDTTAMLVASSVMLITFSAINLVAHLAWKKEIKKYLTKVIYRNELRKEISLRFLTKSFSFKLIQVSATYFIRPDNPKAAGRTDQPEGSAIPDQKIAAKEKNNDISSKNLGNDRESAKSEREPCVFCCDEEPNIMLEPCGHGGVCKKCVINYLKVDDGKCPFCKQRISKLYVLEYDTIEKHYVAKGEINFRV